MKELLGLGTVLVVVGLGVILFSVLSQAKSQEHSTKVSVVGFVGPIPFGFGNDKQLLMYAVVLGAILFILSLWFFRSGLR